MTIPRTEVPGWERRFPGLIAGTTGRRPTEQRPNFGLFTALPAGDAMEAWDGILKSTGMRGAVQSRQVHGAEVRIHRGGVGKTVAEAGLRVLGPADGHATAQRGLLLTVTTADCVPVFIVGAGAEAVCLLHAGWRGTAAGILESGIAALVGELGLPLSGLHIHLGPAICGSCYEVGAEVFEALGIPGGDQEMLDLRGVLAARAKSQGVPGDQVTISELCTKCSGGQFFSHRGGDGGRQIAYLGLSA